MSITTLPPELLFPILTEVLSSRDFKARDVARIASVCRTFYAIVVKYLYSNCDILLHRRPGYYMGKIAHAIALPRFNDNVSVTLANAARTLEAYRSHRREVKILTLKTTRGTVLEGNPPYNGPMKLTSSLPTFTSSLTTTFTSLTTLTLSDQIQTPLPVTSIFPIISNILLTTLTLKHLNLLLTIRRSTSTYTEAQELIESLQQQQQQQTTVNTPPVANLQSLTLDIHLLTLNDLVPRRWDRRLPDPRAPIWFLSSLPHLFPAACLSNTTTLAFTVTGHTLPTVQTAASHPPYNTTQAVNVQIIGTSTIPDYIPKLTLPALESLILSVTEGCPQIFPQYLAMESYRNVRELEIRDAFELGIDGLTNLLLTTFPHVRTLSLKKLDTRRQPINWRFIRTLKNSMDALTSVTAYTKSTISQIQTSLGPIFLANAVQSITRERISRGGGGTEGSEWKVVIEFAY